MNASAWCPLLSALRETFSDVSESAYVLVHTVRKHKADNRFSETSYLLRRHTVVCFACVMNTCTPPTLLHSK